MRIAFDNKFVAESTPAFGPLGAAAFFFTMWVAPDITDSEVVSREVTKTAQGIPSERFVFLYSARKMAMATYYLADESAAVGVVYSFSVEDFDEFKGLADYSFDTFRVD